MNKYIIPLLRLFYSCAIICYDLLFFIQLGPFTDLAVKVHNLYTVTANIGFYNLE